MWIVTNKNLKERKELYKHSFEGYSYYSDGQNLVKGNLQNIWFYKGLILPKEGVKIDLNKNNTSDLLIFLFEKHSSDYISYIKGNFVIIQLNTDGFKIYSDHFATKKFFYWQKENDFIISDELQEVLKYSMAKPDKNSIAIYALTYHFIGGATLYENIKVNQPGQVLEYKNGKIQNSSYWNPGDLLEIGKQDIKISELAKSLTNSIQTSIDYLGIKKISLSLTAGVDSRLLFSIAQNLGIDTHTYTYGNSKSIDCIQAKSIANKYGMQHKIYDINFDKSSFRDYAQKSIEIGQSLASLHRAHRIAAIEKESEFSDSMILGTMGGEFVKGANHDDYIISDFVYEFSQNQHIEVIKKYLIAKNIKWEGLDLDYLLDFFKDQSWSKKPEFVDFFALIDIAASAHHGQNNIQYQNYFKTILTPFLDIDYLEILFKSKYNFLNKKKYRSKFYSRLMNHQFAAELQSYLHPKLAEIPYNSGFIAKEYKFNKYYALLLARYRKNKWISIPNFPLGSWMNEFVLEELKNIYGQQNQLTEIFDITGLINLLENSQVKTNESFWLKYTTPIQMNYLMKLI